MSVLFIQPSTANQKLWNEFYEYLIIPAEEKLLQWKYLTYWCTFQYTL